MSGDEVPAPLLVLVPEENGLKELEKYPQIRAVSYSPSAAPTPEQLSAKVIVVKPSKVDDSLEFLSKLPELELVQTLNAGIERWVGRLPDGVALSNARGSGGAAVAEWVVAVLLAHYRDLILFAESQAQHHWTPKLTSSLAGKKALILGAGDIGVNAKRMLEPFEVEVTLVGRSSRDGVISFDQALSVLGENDIVVVAVPVTPATTRIINSEFLSKMSDGAVLVNAGRGVLVDTDDLVAEASTGRVKAILDVTDPEPLPDDHPLWTTSGVTITPHVAGSTEGVSERSWAVAAQQIVIFASGERPPNIQIDAT